jgi:hypothetical protein
MLPNPDHSGIIRQHALLRCHRGFHVPASDKKHHFDSLVKKIPAWIAQAAEADGFRLTGFRDARRAGWSVVESALCADQSSHRLDATGGSRRGRPRFRFDAAPENDLQAGQFPQFNSSLCYLVLESDLERPMITLRTP